MKEAANVKFRLISITNESHTDIHNRVDMPTISDETLQYQYKIGSVINLAENTIVVTPSVRYCVNNAVIFEAKADFNYSVLSLDAVMSLDMENKKLNMKVNLFPILLSAAYNSLRGIVFANTLSSPLENYPMPVIDTNELVIKNGISVIE
jgi:hypothetical protein